MTDVHIHTMFSEDSRELPENHIEAARRRGVAVIGFSDHCDYDMYLSGHESSLLDAAAYFKKLDELSRKYSDIKILKGVELGFCEGTEEYYGELLSAYSFDYVIMSVHGVKGRGDCYYPDYYKGIDKREAFELYLDAVYKSVTSSVGFNVLGHLGYVARYAPYADRALGYADFSERIDRILRAVIDRGAALELNTSCRGMDAVCVTDLSVIDRYIALGGKYFSFGSDAHGADRYADKADDIKALLKGKGVRFTVHFENGRLVKDEL